MFSYLFLAINQFSNFLHKLFRLNEILILLRYFYLQAHIRLLHYFLNSREKGQTIIRWGILEGNMDDFFIKLITLSLHILLAFEEVDVVIEFFLKFQEMFLF